MDPFETLNLEHSSRYRCQCQCQCRLGLNLALVVIRASAFSTIAFISPHSFRGACPRLPSEVQPRSTKMDSMQSLSPHVDDFSSDIPGQPSGGSKQPTPQGTTHKRTYQACVSCISIFLPPKAASRYLLHAPRSRVVPAFWLSY